MVLCKKPNIFWLFSFLLLQSPQTLVRAQGVVSSETQSRHSIRPSCRFYLTLAFCFTSPPTLPAAVMLLHLRFKIFLVNHVSFALSFLCWHQKVGRYDFGRVEINLGPACQLLPRQNLVWLVEGSGFAAYSVVNALIFCSLVVHGVSNNFSEWCTAKSTAYSWPALNSILLVFLPLVDRPGNPGCSKTAMQHHQCTLHS